MNTFNSLEEATAAGAKSSDRIRFSCEKCLGRGIIPVFHHVNDGQCFDCEGAGSYTRTVATVKGWAVKLAKLAEQEAAERAAEEEARQARKQWNADNPAIAELIAKHAKNIEFAADVRDQVKIPTQGQIDAILRIEERESNKVDVPLGRQQVTGKIVSVKRELDPFSYHESYVTKMLVEDDRGFRVYGTCPKELENEAHDNFLRWVEAEDHYHGDFGPEYWAENFLKGQRVTFTATLEGREKGFGFFKRPTKAQMVK